MMAEPANKVTEQDIDDILDEIGDEEKDENVLILPDLPLIIIFITGNKGKLNELRTFFGDELMKYVINYDIDLEEIQGNEKEIVIHKLNGAKNIIFNKIEIDKTKAEIYIMIEDASLYLGMYSKKGFNFPGPFCKFALKANGCQTYIDMVKYHNDKSCTALVTFGLLRIDSNNNNKYQAIYFQGECKGNITDKERGNNGFGWDCIFEYVGNRKTFAEMTNDEKNKISHRGIALKKIEKYLNQIMMRVKSQ